MSTYAIRYFRDQESARRFREYGKSFKLVGWCTGIWVVVHPPMDQRLIDWTAVRPGQTVCEVLPPKHYLARNKDIVNACDLLLAIPNSPYREHSGTWNTVTYARSISKPIKICFPDGYVE